MNRNRGDAINIRHTPPTMGTPLTVVAGSILSGDEIAEDRYQRQVDAVYAVLQRVPDFRSLDDRGKLDVIDEVLAAAETAI